MILPLIRSALSPADQPAGGMSEKVKPSVSDGSAVRASEMPEPRAVPGRRHDRWAMPRTTIHPRVRGGTKYLASAASLARAIYRWFDDYMGDEFLLFLAVVWILGFIGWLADERTRELLWRAL